MRVIHQFDEIQLLICKRRYTLDTATDYLLGASVNSLDDGDNEFATYFNEVQRVQSIMSKAGYCNPYLLSSVTD